MGRDISSVEKEVFPHLPYLHRMAIRFCGNAHDADDLVQDLLVKLFERPELLDGIEYVKSWMVRCLYNQFIDGVRKRSKVSDIDTDEIEVAADESNSSMPLCSPEGVVDLDELQGAIGESLKSLPADQRAVVVMHDLEGYSLPELSAQLDIPLGTLKSRVHRGRLKLRELLCIAGYGKSGEPFAESVRSTCRVVKHS